MVEEYAAAAGYQFVAWLIFENMSYIIYHTCSIFSRRTVQSILQKLILGWNSFQAWSALDSQHFLVRQRRNRVYGLAACKFGLEESHDLAAQFQVNIDAMQSHCHFPMDKVFFTDEPQEELRTMRERALYEQAVEKATAVTWY